jgi:hypothetical protein
MKFGQPHETTKVSPLQNNFLGLATMIALMAALLSVVQLYALLFTPLYNYALDTFYDHILAQLFAYAFIGLSSAAIFFIARIVLFFGLMVLAENVLYRLAFA